MMCLAVEHHQQKRKVAPVAGTTPDGTLAIDHGKHRHGLAAKRAGSRPSSVPTHADLPDIRVAQPFRGYIHAMLLELLQYAIAPCVQVSNTARRMLRIPVIPDREAREHTHPDH